jgi:hypothetical protein
MFENFSNLPKTLFSPFKCVYIAYIILVALDKISVSGFWEFAFISIGVMALEILHNDFLREKLNKWGKK